MKIVTAAEMRETDRITTEKYRVPSLTLMENAGTAVARFVLQQYPMEQRVTVVCGKGNNGGDGFVAARKLHEAGREVRVLLLGSPDDVRGDARENLRRLSFSPLISDTAEKLAASGCCLHDTDLLIDAIFGTGFRPPLPELAQRAVDLIRESGAPVISVDLPSG